MTRGEGGKARPVQLVEAFGERKALGAWARDPRCPVSPQGLYLRVRVQGLSVEQAFALGPHDPGRPPAAGHPRRGGRKPMRVTAWGETKTLPEWAADPRCRVPWKVIGERLRRKWSPEAAISTPLYERAGGAGPVTAWGEARPVQEWAADPRARASAELIRRRLEEGMAAEDAIATPSRRPWRDRRLTAWGETKPVWEWVRDPRARAGVDVIRARLAAGMAAEEAIGLPVPTRPRRDPPAAD